MKILMISGSRNPDGQTARAADALLAGVREAGGSGDTVLLPTKNIERCRQCNENGWGICWTEHRCCIEDDFREVVNMLIDCDVAVFATPVYFGDMSESLKALLDRLRRCGWKAPHLTGSDNKPAVCIPVAGGGGGGAQACTVRMEEVLTFCGFNLINFTPVRRQNLDGKCITLKETGKWLVTNDHPLD
jgi:multimeric flavodoxin WrbA